MSKFPSGLNSCLVKREPNRQFIERFAGAGRTEGRDPLQVCRRVVVARRRRCPINNGRRSTREQVGPLGIQEQGSFAVGAMVATAPGTFASVATRPQGRLIAAIMPMLFIRALCSLFALMDMLILTGCP